jgi:hypothetical protein
MIIPMSTREYADLRGITIQAVNKAIDNNHSLPGVVSHSKSGRYRILMVDKKKAKKKK